MENRKNQLELPIRYECLINSFGSSRLAVESVFTLRNSLLDPKALILMHGSFLTGVSGNPKSNDFLNPVDQGRRSDIDLILIDMFLFRELPRREIMKGGEKSYSLTYENGKIKDFLKRQKIFRSMFRSISNVQQVTNRRLDIRFYRDLDTWLSLGKNYWILANRDSLCF